MLITIMPKVLKLFNISSKKDSGDYKKLRYVNFEGKVPSVNHRVSRNSLRRATDGQPRYLPGGSVIITSTLSIQYDLEKA